MRIGGVEYGRLDQGEGDSGGLDFWDGRHVGAGIEIAKIECARGDIACILCSHFAMP